jgi:flagellar biosynthetic protein FliQ
MSIEFLNQIGKDALLLIMYLAGPLLGAGLLIGLIISLFQALTQIHEMTLSFVPKIIVVFLVFVLLGPWMLGRLLFFTSTLFINLPNLIR